MACAVQNRELRWRGGEEAGPPLLGANNNPNMELQQLLHKQLRMNYHHLQHSVLQ